MKKFYTAMYDKVFKAILADPNDTELLRILLSCFLNRKVHKITFENSELLKRNVIERAKTVDLLMTADSTKINIELNRISCDWLHFRNYNYFNTIIIKETEAGKKYDVKKEFLHIDITCGIADKKKVPEEKKYPENIEEHYVKNVKYVEYNINKIRKNMKKSNNTCYTVNSKGKKKLYYYLYVLSSDIKELEKIEKSGKADRFVKKYIKKVKELNQDKEFITFLSREDDLQFQKNTERSIGEEIGERRGERRGIKKGKEDGIRIGKKENSIEVAKKLIMENCSINFISKITELPINKINKLVNQAQKEASLV